MGKDSPGNKIAKVSDKDRDDAEKQAEAYWAGYLSGYSAGWSEAVTKSLASIVDLYGTQLAQVDLPDWQSDWNLVGVDLRNSIISFSSLSEVASVLALSDKQTAGLLDPPQATPERAPEEEPSVVETK